MPPPYNEFGETTLEAASGYLVRNQRSAGLQPLVPVAHLVNVSIPMPTALLNWENQAIASLTVSCV